MTGAARFPVWAGLGLIYFAILMVWPVSQYNGAGATPLVSVLGLGGLAWLAVHRGSFVKLAPAAWAGVAFFIWAVARDFAAADWAVASRPFNDWPSIRLGLTIVLGALGWVAVQALGERHRARIFAILLISLAAVLLGVLVFAAFTQPVLAVFYSNDAESAFSEGRQNLLRPANFAAMALPLLWVAGWRLGIAVRAGLVAASAALLWAAADLTTAAGAMAVLAGLAGLALAASNPRAALTAILSVFASVILLAPLFFQALGRLADGSALLPGTAQHRVWIWEAVSERISEAPFFGHGPEASKQWRETFSSRPDWLAETEARDLFPFDAAQFPIIPGHPHNMAMEVWSDLGAVGAVLAAAIPALAAWQVWRRPVPRRPAVALCGILAASMVIFFTTHSVWRDVFWAQLALLAIGATLLARRSEQA